MSERINLLEKVAAGFHYPGSWINYYNHYRNATQMTNNDGRMSYQSILREVLIAKQTENEGFLGICSIIVENILEIKASLFSHFYRRFEETLRFVGKHKLYLVSISNGA